MLDRIGTFIRQYRFRQHYGVYLVMAALVLGVFTYTSFARTDILTTTTNTVFLLLILDLIVLLLLCAAIVRKVVVIWMRRQHGVSGSKLHVRLSVLFGLVAVVPSIIMMVFSVLFFHYGLHAWFGNQIKESLQESLSVAQSYLREHQSVIKKDAHLMAHDIDMNSDVLMLPQDEIDNYLTVMSGLRNVTESIIFDDQSNILGRSDLTIALAFDPISESAVLEADQGEVVLLTGKDYDRVRALVRLKGTSKRYLYVGRFIDAKVLEHLRRVESGVTRYYLLEASKFKFEVIFALIFLLVNLLLLLAAVWSGLLLADRLVTPIGKLILAAERMSAGDLSIRVATSNKRDELSSLTEAFNNMAERLEAQHMALMLANQAVEERRHFIESILSGVSAGVMSLDANLNLELYNDSAENILGIKLYTKVGKSLEKILPSFAQLVLDRDGEEIYFFETELDFSVNGVSKRILVHILFERSDKEVLRYIITFDDITNLIEAQQKAAWGDVARRIAHEVKNPLTPIQLATERIRLKYASQIHENRETFDTCIDTILKYVEQIRILINEFSAFARMPRAKKEKVNLTKICKGIVSIEKTAFPDVFFNITVPDKDILLHCDEIQVRQAITNILKNALESFANVARSQQNVHLRLTQGKKYVKIAIEDNGCGLPTGMDAHDLTKPYVTVGKHGTGLGLAITRKIIQDHQGELQIADNEAHGVTVTIMFKTE